MNINKTPEITFNGTKTVLWNFSLKKYPKALHTLVTQDLETAHALVEQFNRAPAKKQQELFDQIIFYHNYLSATYLQRTEAAKAIGMSKDDRRENYRDMYSLRNDAQSRSISFDQALNPEPDSISSSSAHIAHRMEEVKAERRRQGRKNRQNKKKQIAIVLQSDELKSKKEQ